MKKENENEKTFEESLVELENINSEKKIIDEKLFNLKRFPQNYESEKTLHELINERDNDLNNFIHRFNSQRKKSRKQSKDFLEKNLELYLGVK